MAQHPLPDFAPALALEDPAERTRVALRALYRSYRERAPMTGKVLRDRSTLPALDALLERTMDVQQSRLSAALSAGFRARGPRPERLPALIGLALDYWTWHRLDRESLDDRTAAELMADLIAAAAQSAP